MSDLGRIIAITRLYSNYCTIPCHPNRPHRLKRHIPCSTSLFSRNLPFDEINSHVPTTDINTRRLVPVSDRITLVRDAQHFRPERRTNELAALSSRLV